MRIQLVLILTVIAVVTAKRGHGKRKMKCKYQRGDWGDCDLTTNTVSMTLTLKDTSSPDCVPTQTKTIPCEHLEQIKAWKAKKEERKNKMSEKKMEKKKWKAHKKGLKEKFGMGCEYDVTVTECDKETNLVTKNYKVIAGDEEKCKSEAIAYSCDLHEKLMKWKEKRQQKKQNKKDKRHKNKKRMNKKEKKQRRNNRHARMLRRDLE